MRPDRRPTRSWARRSPNWWRPDRPAGTPSTRSQPGTDCRAGPSTRSVTVADMLSVSEVRWKKMPELKQKIRTDLTAAMKARDALPVGSLRMALAAITNEEVAGSTARELTEREVLGVLAKEVKKRKESAEAF